MALIFFYAFLATAFIIGSIDIGQSHDNLDDWEPIHFYSLGLFTGIVFVAILAAGILAL
jgi:hypothetical protein